MREAGKGDNRRPEDKKAFDEGYDRIFGKKQKPTVKFIGKASFDTEMFPGNEIAHVRTVNHYVWGQNMVRTSKVLTKFPDGSFETMNTLYVPLADEEMDS